MQHTFDGYLVWTNAPMDIDSVLVIPGTKFSQYSEEAQEQSVEPKIADILISKATEVLQKKKVEQRRTILVLSIEQKAEGSKNNGDLLKKLIELGKSYGAETKLIAGVTKWAELLILAKPVIDNADAEELNIIVPKKEEVKCRELVSLVFNKHTYTIEYIPTDVNGTLNEETDGDNMTLVKQILSGIPSSDGLAIQTLKSRIIPNDIFYHGFTTRCGGVSTYSTMKSLPLAMSLRKKDTQVYIEENRKRLSKAEGFNFNKFECASAVHGVDVWIVGDQKPNSYDAIATNIPGYTVAAPGADCQILLFCDVVKKVVAAAHSGWKGTLDRIQQNVVKVMKERFDCKTKDICVSIGPSIGVCCYNVDDGRANEFVKSVGECVVQRRGGIAYLDLWKATVILLEEVGIERKNIDDGTSANDNKFIGHGKVTQCTQCNKDKFFSYRRDGLMFGNQIGFIGINPHCEVDSKA